MARSRLKLAVAPIAMLAGCATLDAPTASDARAKPSPSSGPAVATSPAATAMQQPTLDAFARDIGVRYDITDNSPAQCPAAVKGCFLTTLTFTMPASLPADFHADDLAIYFSFVSRLPLIESDVFEGELLNGDLHRLQVKPGAALVAGQSYTVKLWGEGAHFSESFVMPNFYVTASGLAPRVIAATRPTVDPETGREYLGFVVPMIDRPELANKGGEDVTQWQTPAHAFTEFAARGKATLPQLAIVPAPSEAKVLQGKRLDVTQGVMVQLNGVARQDVEAALTALGTAGAREEVSGKGVPLHISVDAAADMKAESYRLIVTQSGIKIVAADKAGASHALRSLAQQALFDQGKIRPFMIEDAPRYGFRGLHIDLARNFHGKAQLLKLMDAMAAYKFNKLHLHLADDEAWRLEIKTLPELTEIGAKRCHDLTEQSCLLPQLGAGPEGTGRVNGYFSEADYIEILRAAAARHIEIIPSIDMPGHSRAAIRSMEVRYNRLMAAGKTTEAQRYRLVEPDDMTAYRSIQNYNDNTLNVCIDQTYTFLDTTVETIAAMHRMAGTPLRTFHIGADETAGAWSQSPACKKMMADTGRSAKELGGLFIERVSHDLAEKGLKVAGWSDGMGHTDPQKMPYDVQTNIWATLFGTGVEEAHTQANHGWDVVLSIPDLAYFDMPYVPHPKEGGYNWASRSVDTVQIFGFMTDNLPANAARIKDTKGRAQRIEDKIPRQSKRGFTGIQAQLWSETTRTDAGVDYQIFPRLVAFAERAWHKPVWEPDYQQGQGYDFDDKRVNKAAIMKDWNGFAGRMPTQFALLDQLNIAYRITPPGARISNGMLQANSEYPGQVIEYRVDGGPWQHYHTAVAVTGLVELRTRSFDGKRSSRIVIAR